MVGLQIIVVAGSLLVLASPPAHAAEQVPPMKRVDPLAALTLQTVPLWGNGAPGAKGDKPEDKPTLTIFRPDGVKPTGTAVIVAPGGGYLMLSTGHEGRQVADWFAAHGITAFVLCYRLASAGYVHPTQLHDAQRAIRWVRAHAAEYGIEPHRIGMMGFSAGGHLTAMAETLFDEGNAKATDPVDRESSRPDFAVLAYPVIDLDDRFLKFTGIAGPHPTTATLRQMAPHENVSARTPPTFIFHTSGDEAVLTENSTLFYNALRAAKVPAELHIFGEGGHGLGLGMTDRMLSVWPLLLQNWLDEQGLVSGPSANTTGQP